MKTLILAASLMFFAGFYSNCLAQRMENTTDEKGTPMVSPNIFTGTIEWIDTDTDNVTITDEDGVTQVFTCDESILSSLHDGDRVEVTLKQDSPTIIEGVKVLPNEGTEPDKTNY
jgi:cold shock CspA family protein